MPSPPRQLFLPGRRRWSTWAIVLSVGIHSLILLVRVNPWLVPPRRPPAILIVVPPGSEGSQAVEMKFEQPGGSARKGRAAGITPRQEEPAPAPEPTPLPPPPEPVAPAPAPVAPVPAESLGTPDTLRPRLYRIGPSLGQGKLWVRPLPAPPRELAEAITRTHMQLVDSAVAAIVQQYIDSVLSAPAAPGAAPPSWTTQIFGKTFGIDSKYIYLGGLKIPSAVLALLPIKSGGATMEYSQASRLAAIREDLAYASLRAQTLEDFKRAIKELRAERERLHKLQENQKKKPEKADSTKKP
ncbi:MAG TPA: hypothetical protein VGQ69_08280 [Gemmatimonadales bacterium]|nr:hypothetical protein [Gemmatimonadales bacterium]